MRRLLILKRLSASGRSPEVFRFRSLLTKTSQSQSGITKSIFLIDSQRLLSSQRHATVSRGNRGRVINPVRTNWLHPTSRKHEPRSPVCDPSSYVVTLFLSCRSTATETCSPVWQKRFALRLRSIWKRFPLERVGDQRRQRASTPCPSVSFNRRSIEDSAADSGSSRRSGRRSQRSQAGARRSGNRALSCRCTGRPCRPAGRRLRRRSRQCQREGTRPS